MQNLVRLIVTLVLLSVKGGLDRYWWEPLKALKTGKVAAQQITASDAAYESYFQHQWFFNHDWLGMVLLFLLVLIWFNPVRKAFSVLTKEYNSLQAIGFGKEESQPQQSTKK